MIPVKGYAVPKSKAPLEPLQFTRREVGPKDVLIDIHFCGICHSDIHQARDEWGGAVYPMVPGHEIAGVVEKVGSSVARFKPGDQAGVGCFVDSCRECPSCREGLEQYCEKSPVFTYGAVEKDGTRTQGGYSTKIVVDENYVLKISPKLLLAAAAPLLCAGITTYSPLREWKAGPGKKVAIVGLGGLGHMGVKIAAAMGAEVTVLSTSSRKKDDALRMGAKELVVTTEGTNMASMANRFDLIIDTAAGNHDLNAYLNLLRRDGTMVLLGVPETPGGVHPFSLIGRRRRLAGSLIGGIKETQEMLDFCAEHDVMSDIEVIPAVKINEAYERTVKGDVRYRFVINAKTF